MTYKHEFIFILKILHPVLVVRVSFEPRYDIATARMLIAISEDRYGYNATQIEERIFPPPFCSLLSIKISFSGMRSVNLYYVHTW